MQTSLYELTQNSEISLKTITSVKKTNQNAKIDSELD
jgi:hypothetical protein